MSDKFENIKIVELDKLLKSKTMLKRGDILFNSGEEWLSKTIQIVSDSYISHVALIDKVNGQFEIVEADGKVKAENMVTCINKNYNGRIWVGRFYDDPDANITLTLKQINTILKEARSHIGKEYDWASARKILVDSLLEPIEGNNIASTILNYTKDSLHKLFFDSIKHEKDDIFLCSELLESSFDKIDYKYSVGRSGYCMPKHIAHDKHIKVLYEIKY